MVTFFKKAEIWIYLENKFHLFFSRQISLPIIEEVFQPLPQPFPPVPRCPHNFLTMKLKKSMRIWIWPTLYRWAILDVPVQNFNLTESFKKVRKDLSLKLYSHQLETLSVTHIKYERLIFSHFLKWLSKFFGKFHIFWELENPRFWQILTESFEKVPKDMTLIF